MCGDCRTEGSVPVNLPDIVAFCAFAGKSAWTEEQIFVAQEREEKHIYTIDQVAKELGVSKTTVSRAISGKGRIGAETRARVRAFIETHNYRPNAVAKGLAESKTYNIGLVLPSDYAISDLPFFQKCMAGICEMAASQDYDVVLSLVTEQDVSHLKRILRNRKVDGVISTRTTVNDPVIALLQEEKLPFAVIGRCEAKEPIQVDSDHEEACRELTSILLMKGIRRIALIGGNSQHWVSKNRLQGYLDAHEALEVPVDQALIRMDQTGDLQVAKTVDELLELKAECIISMDDALCRLVLSRLQELHLSIPDQIKVASFYNSTLLEQNLPPVTSLKFDAKELGRTACRLLLDRMAGREAADQTSLGYQVILRESTKNS